MVWSLFSFSTLLTLTGLFTVKALEIAVSLLHIDIYMICSPGVKYLDHRLKINSFFTDMLPSAANVAIESRIPHSTDHKISGNDTQVRILPDGVALLLFDAESKTRSVPLC
jgi:hypothetical protein